LEQKGVTPISHGQRHIRPHAPQENYMPMARTHARETHARARTSARHNAITLLKADHKEVKAMVEQFKKSRSDSKKAELAEQICSALEVHATIEEEIFYPAAREALRSSDEELIDEAQVEHTSLKEMIAKIKSATPGDAMWEAEVKVLGEYVNHHVKEEEGEIFPKLRKTSMDLEDIGEQLQQRKSELIGMDGGA
jgi:hemerythrin superfamily protein